MDKIYELVKSKKKGYRIYNFTQEQGDALKSFFDLAQELSDINDLYRLCVVIPKVFLNLDAKLWLAEQKTANMVLFAKTEEGAKESDQPLKSPLPQYIVPTEKPYREKDSLIITIRGKKFQADPSSNPDNILGFLEVYPNLGISEADELFLSKYANRIGYNIHNRYLQNKNIEHLKFIQSLVADIEHNIIVPNMIFKLFLRRLKGKITKNTEIEKLLIAYAIEDQCDTICIERLLDELTEVNRGLTDEFQSIERHYKSTSLFLETLLRKSHFDKGHLTLRTKSCNMRRDVIIPQLERFLERFDEMGIEVDGSGCSKDGDKIISVVDVGLIAQVFANLFSNALKYASVVVTPNRENKKFMKYGREIIKDYFGPDKDGVKFNVFSSGPHIKPEERSRIFDEGFRGSNVAERPGTGHGLTFIKNAVEIHGGVFGYEPADMGNNFYFVLPV
ncbi:MAG: sensor histidine kinase [Nitrospirae bacterium]|nr:sensor histidine kinase [Nitrospirota bacterium]